MPSELRDFLTLPYGELEELNLRAKHQRKERASNGKLQDERPKYLTDEGPIKAVTVLFSDLEGRLHMLDYDKKFLLRSHDNLTFDGSSIRGFTAQRESDLRLGLDWGAFYWAPSDIFGPGKVLVFADVLDRQGAPFAADIRGALKRLSQTSYERHGYTLNAANEIEGFLFNGLDAEQRFHETGRFEYVNTGGYYHSLPGDPLRTFIDTVAEVQRSMGFQNEKDHPEVAPSQFEINYNYGDVVAAADQIQLYKLICRQVATKMEMTASFLPTRRRGQRQRHAHQRLGQQERQESLLGSQRLRTVERVRLEVRRPHPQPRHRNLFDAQFERERVSAPRSAFRSAQSTQGLGHRPRIDGAHSHRQPAQHAHRSPFGRPRCQPVYGDACGLQDRTRSERQQSQKPASGRSLSSRQHLRRAPRVPRLGVDHQAARCGREGALRGSKTGQRRSLSASAGHRR